MALIGRLVVILIGFLASCLVGGMIVVAALLFPEFSDLGAGPVDQGTIDVLLSGTFRSDQGGALAANWVVSNALVQPSLGARSPRFDPHWSISKLLSLFRPFISMSERGKQ